MAVAAALTGDELVVPPRRLPLQRSEHAEPERRQSGAATFPVKASPTPLYHIDPRGGDPTSSPGERSPTTPRRRPLTGDTSPPDVHPASTRRPQSVNFSHIDAVTVSPRWTATRRRRKKPSADNCPTGATRSGHTHTRRREPRANPGRAGPPPPRPTRERGGQPVPRRGGGRKCLNGSTPWEDVLFGGPRADTDIHGLAATNPCLEGAPRATTSSSARMGGPDPDS